MSGPKSADYRLSAAQLRALREQAERIRQEKIRKEKIQREKESLTQKADEINRLGKLLAPVSAEKFLPAEIREQVETLQRECQRAAGASMQAISSDDLERLQQSNSHIKDRITILKKSVSQIYDILPSAIAGERVRFEDQITSAFYIPIPDSIKKDVDIDKNLRQEIQEKEAAIQALSLPKQALAIWKALQQKVQQIQSIDFLENFIALDIDPFIALCKKCDDYQDVRDRYEALAEECHIVPEEFEYSVDGIRKMATAADMLEKQSLADKERERVNAILDDVLREMGYDLVGDRIVAKRSGRQVHHELYSLDDGTAVDVTYGEGGQIIMQLGGIDDTDRMPDPDECDQLVEDMQTFCSGYKRLIERLASKGVEISNTSLMPPSAEHAKFFNIQKYHMKKEVSSYSVRKRHMSGTEKTGRHLEG